MPAKYKKFVELMYENNQDLFEKFEKLHSKYVAGKDADAIEQFHKVGMTVRDRVRDWERRLCRTQTKGQYSQYAGKLSEKFWNAVRERFPKIDEVGIKKS